MFDVGNAGCARSIHTTELAERHRRHIWRVRRRRTCVVAVADCRAPIMAVRHLEGWLNSSPLTSV